MNMVNTWLTLYVLSYNIYLSNSAILHPGLTQRKDWQVNFETSPLSLKKVFILTARRLDNMNKKISPEEQTFCFSCVFPEFHIYYIKKNSMWYFNFEGDNYCTAWIFPLNAQASQMSCSSRCHFCKKITPKANSIFFGTWPLTSVLNFQLKDILIKGSGMRKTDKDGPGPAERMLIKNKLLYGVNLWALGWLKRCCRVRGVPESPRARGHEYTPRRSV